MTAKVYCSRCYTRFRSRRNISAKRQRDEHIENMHVKDGEIVQPALRPTDKQAEPERYDAVRCEACRETLKEPSWKTNISGGSERDQATAVAGDPIRMSRFWTKRKVTLEIDSWVGTGVGAKHYYFHLKEQDDYPIIREPDWSDKTVMRTVVYSSIPYGDPGRGRRVDDNRDLFDRESAVKAGIEKYLSEFGCKTHYLHYIYYITDEDKETARRFLKSLREGD